MTVIAGKIGIFWVYKNKVIGRTKSLDECVAVNNWIDSPEEHSAVWEDEPAFEELRKSRTEYFKIPRGRVVWNQKENKPVVYADKTLLSDEIIKQKIAKFFKLNTASVLWEADSHYTTDENDLSALFG